MSSANAASATDAMQMAQTVNQANQTLNKVSAAIPQETKDFMQSAKEKILDSDKLRSFSLFFGIGEGSGFSPTINPTILCPRLKKNMLFFYLNYILLAAVVVVITLFATMINPKTIIMLAILLVAWLFVIRSTADGGLEIRGGAMTISRKSATTVMMVISAVVLFFMVKSVFFVTLGSASVLALIHALLRDATKYSSDDGSSGPLNSQVEMA